MTTAATGPEFHYSDLLPTAGSNGAPETPYRLVTTEGVSTVEVGGRTFLQVEPEAIRRLTEEAMHDISHYLRPGHLAQLRKIIDDPEASGNDRFVALDLLKNVNISAGGVLPMCQDTGTAIVMGKKSEGVLTGADDGEAISRGVYDAYTRLNLRYSQLAPLTTFEEKNTGTNLPAQIELYSTPAKDVPEYKFLFMAKGGGSANKSFLFQETKAVLNPTRLMEFLDEKIRSLGTAACPPYHLAVVIGGTSAEFALKTAKYASAHYLDDLPTEGSMAAHGIRDIELEEKVFELTQSFGIGAQFGGKYFCHDVRVVRLPRHGASCPVAIAVSCSADRQALGKITPEGVFLEQLETDPAHYMPDAGMAHDIEGGAVVPIDLNQPMADILAELSKHPVKTRLSLTGPLVVARDIAHAKIKERLDAGEEMPAYLKDHPVYYAGPAKTPDGHGVRLLRPDDRRPDGLLRRAVPGRRRLDGHARQGQPLQAGHRGLRHPRRLLPRLHRRPRRPPRAGLHQVRRGRRVRGARHGGRLEDRGRGLPRLHRRRRQGQRLLHRPLGRRHRADTRSGRHPGPLGAVGHAGRHTDGASAYALRMTSVGALPAAGDQRLLDLVEERLRLEPQAQERQPEDPVAGDDERVLAQGVADDVRGPRVVDAVDLDHQAELVPVEVEVVAVCLVAASAPDASAGQPAPPQLAYDVELTERARTVEQVEDRVVDQPSAPVPLDAERLRAEQLGGGEALLHDQREQVDRLLVGRRPQSRADAGDVGTCARDPGGARSSADHRRVWRMS